MSDHSHDPSPSSNGDEKSLKAPPTGQEALAVVDAEHFYSDFEPAQVEFTIDSAMVLGQVVATNERGKMSFMASRQPPVTSPKRRVVEISAQDCTKPDPDGVLDLGRKRMRKSRCCMREGFENPRLRD